MRDTLKHHSGTPSGTAVLVYEMGKMLQITKRGKGDLDMNFLVCRKSNSIKCEFPDSLSLIKMWRPNRLTSLITELKPDAPNDSDLFG